MDKNKDNPYYSAKVQKILNKLISEEKLASEFYKDFVILVGKEYRSYVEDMFLEIAKDEFEDHYEGLCAFAEEFGYEIPTGFQALSKNAGDLSVRFATKMKKDQDALYYVERGIESEVDAIKSYEKALKDLEDETLEYGNLRGILLNNYYDEIEHLNNLTFLLQNLKCEFGDDVLDLNIQE